MRVSKFVMSLVLMAMLLGLTPSMSQASTDVKQQNSVTPRNCFATATSFSGTVPGVGYLRLGPYTTTAACLDINFRFSSVPRETQVEVYTCGGAKLGTTVIFPAGNTSWRTIATNVRDGTCFEYRVDDRGGNFFGYQVSGFVAF